jgi:hypothetical protein
MNHVTFPALFKLNKSLLFLLYILTALLIVFLCWRKVSSLDAGFHLHAGQWITENKSFPRLDTFSFTVNGAADYLDFNWLYQLMLYAIYSVCGYPGLVFMNVVVVLLSFFLIVVRSRIQGAQWDLRSLIILIISIMAISILYEIRPHIFSWVLLNLVLLCLEDYDKNKTVRSLYMIPLVMLFWVNIHSLFILGIVCIVCYNIAFLVKNLKPDAKLRNVLIFSLLACLCNPYTYLSLLYPFRQFKLLRMDNPFNQSISELSSSLKFDPYLFWGQFKILNPLSFYHFILVLFIILFITKFKKISLPALLTIVAFSYIGITAVKNIGYQLFAVLPYFISYSSAIYANQRDRKIKQNLHHKKNRKESSDSKVHSLFIRYFGKKFTLLYAPILLIVCMICLLISIETNRFYISQRLHSSFGNTIDETTLPAEAARFICDKKIECPTLNHLNFGAYLMHATSNKVFIDGRLEVYGEAFYKAYLKLSGSEQGFYFKQFTERYQLKAIIFPYEISPSWVTYLKKDTDWRLVYYDETAALYLKNNYRMDIKTADSSFIKNRMPSVLIDKKPDYYINRSYDTPFFKQHYFPYTEKATSFFMYINGWTDSAIEMAERAQLNASAYYPELLFNLGSYYYKKRSYQEAQLCYSRFLLTNDHPIARKRNRVR